MKERDIFIEALPKDAPEREAYLGAACANDRALSRRVEQLLAEHEKQESFFLDAPLPGVHPTIDQPVKEQLGTMIGPYKLLQQIGEGGMGVVYLAEQTEPVQRKVALKVIKPGMDSRQVIARFEAERQALAMMDHVNIARVLDAGATESGRPYFVMELVHGVPITKYCDDNHFTPRQRLELFVPVCQAIQHAHQKGIIHRDIKPSNVLVTLYDGQPVPKVIDFGVAKATEQKLTDRTLFTQCGALVGTLEYMSPEQAEMSALGVDTRSDIYSLGVLLYELLTGSTPLSSKRMKEAAYDEILRLIKEEEPPKPSTRLNDSGEALASISAQRHMEPAKLAKLVRGELDWIVMKTLEKDRNRRYETANAFVADVQRYLNDEPVLACPPSGWYRMRKFARRNKGGLAVVGLVLFFLVCMGGGVGWVARDRTVRQLVTDQVINMSLWEAEELQNSRNWPGALAAVKRAEAALASAGADAALEQRVRERLADLLMVQRLDEIRLRQTQSFGEPRYQDADREYATAFREYGIDMVNLSPADAAQALRSRPGVAIALAAALDDWAYVRWGRGDRVGGSAIMEVALAADPDPFRQRLREALRQREWKALVPLAASEELRGQPPATFLLLGLFLRKVGPGRDLPVFRRGQQEYPGDFWINHILGQVLFVDGGADHREEAISYLRCAVAVRPQSSVAHIPLGRALEAGGRHDEAIACFRRAIGLQENNRGPHFSLGTALRRKGQYEEAIASFRTAIALEPDDAGAYAGLAWLLTTCADLRFRDPTEAVVLARRAVELSPLNGACWLTLGAAHYRAGDPQAAVTSLQKAMSLRAGGNSSDWFFLALARLKEGHKEEARKWYDEAVAWMNKNQPEDEEFRRFRAETSELMGIKQNNE